MKRNIIITLLCAFTACCAWGQINAPCFTIPVPADTPTYYTLYTIDEDSTIINLNNAPIYALAITGHAYLQSPTNSMVRIILVDNYGHEHLVFETNSLLSDTTVVEFLNAGRETLWENMINASHLIVRLRNATIEMNTPVLITQLLEESTPTIKRARSLAQSDTIVNVLNRHLIARDIPWRAGRTDLAEKEYNERRMILGDENPFDNIEYYIGGYYVDPAFDAAQSPAVDDGYVEEFDWRNRHGKNWMTAPRQQNWASCWAFGTVGTIEAYLNLYYNQLINIDISEQQFQKSCINAGCSHRHGGHSSLAFNAILNRPLVTEYCYPYKLGEDESICNICDNPDTTVTIYNYSRIYDENIFNNTVANNIKRLLYKAPICYTIRYPWYHVMVLLGYKKVLDGDTIFYPDETCCKDAPIVIDSSSPYLGQTAWLLKNSAEWWFNPDENGNDIPIGYQYVILSNHSISAEIVTDSISCSFLTHEDVVCSDEDNDGYYFWGIGDKPAHCPEWASDVADGDDSNPMYGPMDEYGNLQEIGPVFNEALIINTDTTWSTPQVVSSDLIIPSGVTLTITSYLTMHPDAQILIQGGKLVLNGGTIRNGDIRNNGNLTILNNGIVEMCGNDQYRHKSSDLDVINNGNTPFPATTNMQRGAFKRVNR